MKLTITVIAFIISAIVLVGFMSADACMDSGGISSKYGFACEGAYEGFIPQYERQAPFFWLLVFFVSLSVAFAAFKATSKVEALTSRSSRDRANRATP
jgi:hypothetical protein